MIYTQKNIGNCARLNGLLQEQVLCHNICLTSVYGTAKMKNVLEQEFRIFYLETGWALFR